MSLSEQNWEFSIWWKILKNLNSDENISNSIHILRKFTYKHWLKRILEQEIIVIHRILSILFKVLNEKLIFQFKNYILDYFRMSVDLKCLFELLKQCWLIYGKRKKWIKMTSMAAVRRAKVIFELESGFWTKNLKFFQVQSPNVFPSGPTVWKYLKFKSGKKCEFGC